MRLKTAVPAQTEREAAAYVAGVLLRHLEGPATSPASWQAVASRLGIQWRTYHVPKASRGEFRASEPDGFPAVVAINTAYPDQEVSRAYAHEINHVVIYRMQPPMLPGYGDAGRYEGEPRTRQHRIARAVEALVVGE